MVGRSDASHMWSALLRAPRAVAQRLPRIVGPAVCAPSLLLHRLQPAAALTTLRLTLTARSPPPAAAGMSSLARAVSLRLATPTSQALPCATDCSVRTMRMGVGHKRNGSGRRIKRGGHKMGGARAQPRRRTTWEKMTSKTKLKTHHGAANRFHLRGDGTWKFTRAGKKHLMAGASRRRQTAKKLAKGTVTTKGFIKKLFQLMPYAKKYAQRRAG